MTEWARRIQASIESMNKLVDGFQLAGGNTPGAGGSQGSDAIPGRAGASPVATSSAYGPTADLRAATSSGSSDPRNRRADGGLGGPSAAHGVESFATAQLGFRRGLEGLLADRTSGGGAGRGRTTARFGGSSAWMPEDILEGVATSGGDGDSDSGSDSDSEGRSNIAGLHHSSSKDGASGSGSDRRGSAGDVADRSAEDTLSAFAEQLLGGGGGGSVTALTPTSTGGLMRDDRSRDDSETTEKQKSGERFVESSSENVSTGWEETKGEGGQRRGGWTESGTDDEQGRSLSSMVGREGAAAVGRRGGAGAIHVLEGSMASSSSASFGPDLEAEIATLEALAESLQQRKMRFEPKVIFCERTRSFGWCFCPSRFVPALVYFVAVQRRAKPAVVLRTLQLTQLLVQSVFFVQAHGCHRPRSRNGACMYQSPITSDVAVHLLYACDTQLLFITPDLPIYPAPAPNPPRPPIFSSNTTPCTKSPLSLFSNSKSWKNIAAPSVQRRHPPCTRGLLLYPPDLRRRNLPIGLPTSNCANPPVHQDEVRTANRSRKRMCLQRWTLSGRS